MCPTPLAQRAVNVYAGDGGDVSCVGLAGEIDMVEERELSDVAELLGVLAPHAVVVDVADVTFAGSTLMNFLARLRNAIPDRASVSVCRPPPMLRLLFDVIDMHGMGSPSYAMTCRPSGPSLPGSRETPDIPNDLK